MSEPGATTTRYYGTWSRILGYKWTDIWASWNIIIYVHKHIKYTDSSIPLLYNTDWIPILLL